MGVVVAPGAVVVLGTVVLGAVTELLIVAPRLGKSVPLKAKNANAATARMAMMVNVSSAALLSVRSTSW